MLIIKGSMLRVVCWGGHCAHRMRCSHKRCCCYLGADRVGTHLEVCHVPRLQQAGVHLLALLREEKLA